MSLQVTHVVVQQVGDRVFVLQVVKEVGKQAKDLLDALRAEELITKKGAKES